MKRKPRSGWKDAGVERVTADAMDPELQPLLERTFGSDKIHTWLERLRDKANRILEENGHDKADTHDAEKLKMHADTLLTDLDKNPAVQSVIYRAALLALADQRLRYREHKPERRENLVRRHVGSPTDDQIRAIINDPRYPTRKDQADKLGMTIRNLQRRLKKMSEQ